MKAQHTPGPWHHDDYGHICAGPNVIGEVYTFELNDKQRDEYLPWEGNAELIAAAPELLDVLQRMTPKFMQYTDEAEELYLEAKALIKKLNDHH